MNDLAFLIMGIVMTAIGIVYPTLTLKRRASCKEKIKATVVKVEKKTHYNGDNTVYKYLPTFSYTVDGKEYITKSDLETLNMLKYKEGNEVDIRYNPDSPETICVGKKVFPYVCGVLFTLLGISLLACYFL